MKKNIKQQLSLNKTWIIHPTNPSPTYPNSRNTVR